MRNSYSIRAKQLGFTMIEILLAITLLIIIAGGALLLINPQHQLESSANKQRKADVTAILTATYQYSVDNDGKLPEEGRGASITETPKEICATEAKCSDELIDFSQLTDDQKYLKSIPIDPSNPKSPSSGYAASFSDDGSIVIMAPYAENNEHITATR